MTSACPIVVLRLQRVKGDTALEAAGKQVLRLNGEADQKETRSQVEEQEAKLPLMPRTAVGKGSCPPSQFSTLVVIS